MKFSLRNKKLNDISRFIWEYVDDSSFVEMAICGKMCKCSSTSKLAFQGFDSDEGDLIYNPELRCLQTGYLLAGGTYPSHSDIKKEINEAPFKAFKKIIRDMMWDHSISDRMLEASIFRMRHFPE